MTDKNIFAVGPGDICSINLVYGVWMEYGPNYGKICRNIKLGGCIVQLYYGMQDTFSKGVVERGINHHQGESFAEFKAP